MNAKILSLFSNERQKNKATQFSFYLLNCQILGKTLNVNRNIKLSQIFQKAIWKVILRTLKS